MKGGGGGLGDDSGGKEGLGCGEGGTDNMKGVG
jgi:hypothetical protein